LKGYDGTYSYAKPTTKHIKRPTTTSMAMSP